MPQDEARQDVTNRGSQHGIITVAGTPRCLTAKKRRVQKPNLIGLPSQMAMPMHTKFHGDCRIHNTSCVSGPWTC